MPQRGRGPGSVGAPAVDPFDDILAQVDTLLSQSAAPPDPFEDVLRQVDAFLPADPLPHAAIGPGTDTTQPYWKIGEGASTLRGHFSPLEAETIAGSPAVRAGMPLPATMPITQAPPVPVLPKPKKGQIPAVEQLNEMWDEQEALRWRQLNDVGLSVAQGAYAVAEAPIGLADLVTKGRAGQALEKVGIAPGQWSKTLDGLYSPEEKAAQQAFHDATGLVDKALAALTHPSLLVHGVIKSVPSMAAGSAVGRLAMAAGPAITPAIGSAIGEGVIQAGSAAEQSRQESPTGLISDAQAGAAVASGALDTMLSLVGGRIASKLGIADPDVLLTAGTGPAKSGRSVATQMVLGAIEEGVFEELPQSVQEQMLANAAAGKPLTEGLQEAAIMGAATGGAMGAGAQVAATGPAKSHAPGEEEVPPPVPPAAPAVQVPPPGVAETVPVTPGAPPPPGSVPPTAPPEPVPPPVSPGVTPPGVSPETLIAEIKQDLESVGAVPPTTEPVTPAGHNPAVSEGDVSPPGPPAPAFKTGDRVQYTVSPASPTGTPQVRTGTVTEALPNGDIRVKVEGMDAPRYVRASMGATLVGTEPAAPTGQTAPISGPVVSAPVPPTTDAPAQTEQTAEISGDVFAPAQPAAPRLTYDAFKKAYTDAFHGTMSYTPDQVGSRVFSDKMAALADEYPEWAARVEAEAAAPAKPSALPAAKTDTPAIDLSQNPHDTAGPSKQLQEIRDKKPRPLNKLYGPNPTADQQASHAEAMRNWNRRHRAAKATFDAALENSNNWIQLQRDQAKAGVGAPNAGQAVQTDNAGVEAGARPGDGHPQPDAAASGGVQPAGERGSRRRAREVAAAERRAADDADLDTLIQHAQASGHTGDPAPLRQELADRLQVIREFDAESDESGTNPLVLLRAIAKGGGISEQKETGQKGEIRQLKEYQDTRPSKAKQAKGNLARQPVVSGQVRGVRGVYKQDGLTLDGMVEYLQQDPRFAHITGLRELVAALEDASVPDTQTAASQHRDAMRLRNWIDSNTWAQVGTASDSVVEDEGDVSFDPAELEQQADVLDTGEVQPRLPGAEQVREQDVKTPEFEAPYSLTGEVAKAPKAEEADLFAGREEGEDQPPRTELPSRAKAALPVKPVAVPPVNARQLSPREIIKLFEKLGITIRTGGFRAGLRQAIFKKPEKVIRTRIAEDIPSIAHEVGHAVDQQYSYSGDRHAPWAKELMTLGLVTAEPNATKRTLREEGVGEFVRLWLTNPAVAAQQAPIFGAHFAQTLGGNWRDVLTDAQQQITGYVQMDSVDQFKSKIDMGGIVWPRSWAEADRFIGERIWASYDKWYDRLWDDYGGIKVPVDAMGRPTAMVDDPQKLAVQARSAAAVAQAMVDRGIRDKDKQRLSIGLKKILQPVHKRLHDFVPYITAMRARELAGLGKETGWTTKQIDDTIARYQNEPGFEDARKGVTGFAKAINQYLLSYGMLDQAALKAMDAVGEFYVPMNRVMDVVASHAGGGGGGGIANQRAPGKRMTETGSARTVINPLESLVRNLYDAVNASLQNDAARAFVELAGRTTGSGVWMDSQPTPMRPVTFDMARLEKDIREQLTTGGQNAKFHLQLPDDLDFTKIVDVWMPVTFADGKKQYITVMIDGARQFFAVHDRRLFDAMTAMGPAASLPYMEIFKPFTDVLRATATSANVTFGTRNIIRDQWVTYVQTNLGFKPAWDPGRAVARAILGDFENSRSDLLHSLGKADEVYDLFLTSGVLQAALLGNDRKHLSRDLRKLTGTKAMSLATRMGDTAQTPIGWVQAYAEYGELATRFGTFARVYETETAAGTARPEAVARASWAARTGTIDYQVGGSWIRSLNHTTAFIGARVGGYRQAVQAWKANPVRFTAKAVGTISLLSAALWWLNDDDELYDEIPQWEKNMYWHLSAPYTKSGFIRFPKPFELGTAFGTSVELFLDYLKDEHPEALRERMQQAFGGNGRVGGPVGIGLELLMGSLIPTAAVPPLEIQSNFNRFQNRQIINEWEVGKENDLLVTRWTTETAKTLGATIHMAPIHVEHLIYGYTGGFGRMVLQGADQVAYQAGMTDKAPPYGIARSPIFSAVYRDAIDETAASIQELYALRDRAVDVRGSINDYRKGGEHDKANALQAENQKLLARARLMEQATEAMQDLRDKVYVTRADASKTPLEQREALNQIYRDMVDTARTAIGKKPIFWERKPFLDRMWYKAARTQQAAETAGRAVGSAIDSLVRKVGG